jgi:pimeloyl-ACP methyl ester carboxylesterase
VFPTGDGGAAGDATAFGLGSLDLLDKAREELNSTTYYKMKKRSGLVADKGLVPLLDALAAADGAVRVHLVGHSFGARLVSRAAATTQTTVSSLSLLQGAFSHRAFAADNGASKPAVPGAFRPALSGALTGPAMATHTHNDRAVGVAYAVASRLAQQAGSSLGGPDDVYGGLGANGAVATAEADEAVLGGVRSDYTFTPRRILNLKADATIANHGDVSNEAVANALLQLVLSAT